MSSASTTGALGPERALPRQAMIFFIVAPPVLAFLFDPNCIKDASHVWRAIAAIGGYTIVTGLGVHYSFELVARQLRSRGPALRLVVHGVVVIAVVGLCTAGLFPLVALVYPEAGDAFFMIYSRGVVVSVFYLTLASFIAHLMRQAVDERTRAQADRLSALEARLAVLTAQLQPHFLFNSLNVCAELVHEDADAAEETLETLAGFLRYTLESTERPLVTLADELEAVRGYLEVQRRRFGERFESQIDVSDECSQWSLPPMTLQPLVENAFHHGLRSRTEGGRVYVRACVEEGLRTVVVEDDGVGPGLSSHTGTGTGLRNVRERLRLTLGEDARVATSRSSLGGFAARVILGPCA